MIDASALAHSSLRALVSTSTARVIGQRVGGDLAELMIAKRGRADRPFA